jgi:hypothetical protein
MGCCEEKDKENQNMGRERKTKDGKRGKHEMQNI